ncbi:similar to MgpA-like protein of M. synoviae [Mycoplasma suis KI3806]|uniref:Similar to MgpA-like protein of M. synoviae n=1 Tax=Mycoplasma suis (strain KI_3806) TaxID=708248 RepID=F0V3A7_MYCS3|nr:bifunctional oligoribonuclease/PAP phosphatase NrnA [Mycoplasma suis]CBZ40329.1 similar to MgpA-like protein of M. synoviae [Mycoplasma suis KI3806]
MFFRKKRVFDQVITQKAKERDFFLKNFQHYVRRFTKIVIFIHERPDGDCLGGGLGMKEVLRSQFLDKEIYLVGSSQGVFPWLNMEFDELPHDFDFSSAMALVVDVTIGERTQKFVEYFKSLGTEKWGAVIRVDHHDVHTDFYTDLSWVDGSYAAASCQLFQICDYYQWPINKKAATYFYLGILTDSGSFSNSEVSPRTLVLAAKALRAGADREFLINNLRRLTVQELKLRGHILSNYHQDEKFAWYLIEKEVVDQYTPYATSSGLVSTIGHIEDNVLWMLFAQEQENVIVTSFRSLGNFDVRVLAEEFGGGGHMNAAGTTLDSVEKVSMVVERARELVKEFIENGGMLSKDEERNNSKEEFEEEAYPPYQLGLDEEQKETLEDSQEVVEQIKEELASEDQLEEVFSPEEEKNSSIEELEDSISEEIPMEEISDFEDPEIEVEESEDEEESSEDENVKIEE